MLQKINTLKDSPSLDESKRLIVGIEFTNACNFRCPICPQSFRYASEPQPAGAPYDRKIGNLSQNAFNRILSECEKVAKTVELNFFGEQTLHPKYLLFLDKLKMRRNYRLVTNTNMSLMDERIMQGWIDAKLDQVRLSIDAIDDEVLDIARPGNVKGLDGKTYKKNRINVLHEKMEQWFSLPDHCPTRLVFVESQYNKGQSEKFIKYWQPKLGPNDELIVKPILSYGGKISDPTIATGTCNVWELKMCQIDWMGNVSPCNLDVNMDLSMGNIMKDSLYDIYYSDYAYNLRQETGCGKDIVPCKTCNDSNFWDGTIRVCGGP